MRRIILMVIRNILLVPFMWFKLCYHASHVDKYTEEEHYKMIKFIDRRANKGGNVHIKKSAPIDQRFQINCNLAFLIFGNRSNAFAKLTRKLLQCDLL